MNLINLYCYVYLVCFTPLSNLDSIKNIVLSLNRLFHFEEFFYLSVKCCVWIKSKTIRSSMLIDDPHISVIDVSRER